MNDDKFQDWILEDFIEELKEAGDALLEIVEGFENDPVVSAYLKERAEYLRPGLGANVPRWDFGPETSRWDEVIGELQQRRLVDKELTANLDNLNVECIDEYEDGR
jgi:hypothetical protein